MDTCLGDQRLVPHTQPPTWGPLCPPVWGAVALGFSSSQPPACTASVSLKGTGGWGASRPAPRARCGTYGAGLGVGPSAREAWGRQLSQRQGIWVSLCGPVSWDFLFHVNGERLRCSFHIIVRCSRASFLSIEILSVSASRTFRVC